MNIFVTTCLPSCVKKWHAFIHLSHRHVFRAFCLSGMLVGTRPSTQSAESLVYISGFLYTLVIYLKWHIMIFQRRRPLVFLLVSLNDIWTWLVRVLPPFVTKAIYHMSHVTFFLLSCLKNKVWKEIRSWNDNDFPICCLPFVFTYNFNT